MSAASTAAMYYGADTPALYATSLALPVVSDIALQTFFSGWIWMEKVRYYWFLGSTGFAAILAAISLLCLVVSFSGNAFHGSFAGKSISKIFSAFGIAQLMSSRALSAFGILFYLLDVILSAALIFAFPQAFTPVYLFLLANVLIHFLTLSFLGFSFTASIGGRSEKGSE